MESNPIVETLQAKEAERKANESFRYPFRVVGVYLDAANSDFPIFSEVKTYCDMLRLTYGTRPYDAEKYEEDVPVNRLPAFHVYSKGYVYETHYYDVDPGHKLQLLVWAYQDEEKRKERARMRRQARWDSFVGGLQSVFSLDRFKRKPALDLEKSLQHTQVSSTGGTPSEAPSTPPQTQRRASRSE